ncbi:MAG: hypothetical protein OXL68_04575, partial [Paracoccaceae bacterium]|nr:hypothetical protein [Paracoccaceae bacterium]
WSFNFFIYGGFFFSYPAACGVALFHISCRGPLAATTKIEDSRLFMALTHGLGVGLIVPFL